GGVLYDKIPRYGHWTVDLSVDHRKSRRKSVRLSSAAARISVPGYPSLREGLISERVAMSALARGHCAVNSGSAAQSQKWVRQPIGQPRRKPPLLKANVRRASRLRHCRQASLRHNRPNKIQMQNCAVALARLSQRVL